MGPSKSGAQGAGEEGAASGIVLGLRARVVQPKSPPGRCAAVTTHLVVPESPVPRALQLTWCSGIWRALLDSACPPPAQNICVFQRVYPCAVHVRKHLPVAVAHRARLAIAHRAHLALCWGDFRVRNASDHAPAAYFASWALVLSPMSARDPALSAGSKRNPGAAAWLMTARDCTRPSMTQGSSGQRWSTAIWSH